MDVDHTSCLFIYGSILSVHIGCLLKLPVRGWLSVVVLRKYLFLNRGHTLCGPKLTMSHDTNSSDAKESGRDSNKVNKYTKYSIGRNKDLLTVSVHQLRMYIFKCKQTKVQKLVCHMTKFQRAIYPRLTFGRQQRPPLSATRLPG